MKKEIEIRKFDTEQDSLEKVSQFHREIFLDSPFENRLIYFDDNFKRYLTKVVVSADHFLYVVLFKEEIKGFLHFKAMNDVLFLNNFYVSEVIRGQGIGKRLLFETLINHKSDFKKVELEVFQNNKRALKLYVDLGFEIGASKLWCIILDSNRTCMIDSKSEDFRIGHDRNGFSSLFYKEDKVGTLVNETLIVHDERALSFSPEVSLSYLLNDVNILLDDSIKILDKSITLSVDIVVLINNLKRLAP